MQAKQAIETLLRTEMTAEHSIGDGFLDWSWAVDKGPGRHQTAEAHQEVDVGHGLDEIAGGVMVQQWSTVEHKDDGQVSCDDEQSQKYFQSRL